MSGSRCRGIMSETKEEKEHRLATMFYEECMEQAGIENYPPLDKDPPEACGPGFPLSNETVKG